MEEILEKILNIQPEDLNNLNTSYIDDIINFESSYYHLRMDAGREHYRLLMYISTLFNNQTLFDIGTNTCRSAIALSRNPTNKIISYDIIKVLPENPVLLNVEYNLGDSTKDERLKATPLIFLDVDHDGTYENILFNHLKEIEWKGILLLDDIHLNDAMKSFWNNIIDRKYVLTSRGHWSGTGLVILE
jgi:hypothetical protein